MRKIYLFIVSIFFSTFINGQITIDGDFSDWSGVPVLINDATGDGSNGWDFDNIYVTDDATNVYFRIQTTSSVAGSKTLYLLISVDPQNEPSTRTGLSYGWWDNGYDFMVQYYQANVTLYRHTGDTDGWSWENGGTNSQEWKQTNGSDDYSDIEIAVSKNDLDQPNIAGWTSNSQDKITIMTFVDDGSFGEEAGSGSNHGGVVYTLGQGVLPVELVSFSAHVNNNSVSLEWNTATEHNNYGFEIQRLSALGETDVLRSEFETIGFVKGAGNSNSPKKYFYADKNPPAGKVQYRLKQIDLDGAFKYSEVVEVEINAPKKFELIQNYPNPFNPTTNITYVIPRSEATRLRLGRTDEVSVKLRVYDALGREVATLVNAKQSPGNYSVKFNASKLGSGIYYYTLRAGDFVQTKKMILMK